MKGCQETAPSIEIDRLSVACGSRRFLEQHSRKYLRSAYRDRDAPDYRYSTISVSVSAGRLSHKSLHLYFMQNRCCREMGPGGEARRCVGWCNVVARRPPAAVAIQRNE